MLCSWCDGQTACPPYTVPSLCRSGQCCRTVAGCHDWSVLSGIVDAGAVQSIFLC